MLTMDKDKVVWALTPIQSARGVALIIVKQQKTSGGVFPF